MQDQVNEKVVAVSVRTTKLTALVLQAAIKQVLAKMKAQRGKMPRGKQTLKQLMRQDSNIKDFTATAKKYGIDFALKKDATEIPPRYLVFFKGRDADVLTAAFKEFSAKKLTKEQKPSIKKLLATMKEKAVARNAQREKVNKKDRGLTL